MVCKAKVLLIILDYGKILETKKNLKQFQNGFEMNHSFSPLNSQNLNKASRYDDVPSPKSSPTLYEVKNSLKENVF